MGLSFPEAHPLSARSGRARSRRSWWAGRLCGFPRLHRNVRPSMRVVDYALFNVFFLSCSMVTAKIILLSTGSIKKKVKKDTGSRKNQNEKRNIEKKAARGKKERGIQEGKVVRSLTRKGKKDTERDDTKKAPTWMTRSTEEAWRKRTDHRRKSTRRGNPRYCSRHVLPSWASCAQPPGWGLCLGAAQGRAGTQRHAVRTRLRPALGGGSVHRALSQGTRGRI